MKYHTNNAYIHSISKDPRNDISVVVGDDKKTPFEPQMKMSRFGNEANISVRLQGLPVDDRKKIRQTPSMVEYGDNKKKMRTYLKDDNNWEFEWVLYEKPASMVEELTMQIKNCDFFYQPPLNEEITPGEGETVTATHHYDKDGNVLAHRPEDIVGSYAVYLSRGKCWNRQSPNMAMWYSLQDEFKSRESGNEPKAFFAHLDSRMKLEAEISKYARLSAPELLYNKTYMTGKFCHIYRPKLIDANGNESWADIDIDREKAEMTITYNKDFLDTAAYPVVVDPTFGYTSIGGSNSNANTPRIIGMLGNPGESGTVSKISAYTRISSGSINCKGALYLKSDDSLVSPQSDETSVDTTAQLWDFNVSSTLNVSNQDYYVACWYNTNCYRYWDTAGGDSISNQTSYGAWPDPHGGADLTNRYSIYATYTASGGGSTFTSRNNTIF